MATKPALQRLFGKILQAEDKDKYTWGNRRKK